MRILAIVAVAALVLAGCAGKSENASTTAAGTGTASSTTSSSNSGTATSGTTSITSSPSSSGDGAKNHYPSATLTPSLLAGPAPLVVNFTIGGADSDGDALTYTLSFADASADATGSGVPANVTHKFTAVGNFTVMVTISDGKATANATTRIQVTAVTAGGALPADLSFEGTATGALAVPQVGSPNMDTYEFPFKLEGSATTMTVTLAYADPDPEKTGLVADLDIDIAGPGVTQVSENQGEEPPVVIPLPAAGDWTLTVIPYSVPGTLDFTVTVHFE